MNAIKLLLTRFNIFDKQTVDKYKSMIIGKAYIFVLALWYVYWIVCQLIFSRYALISTAIASNELKSGVNGWGGGGGGGTGEVF